MFSKACLLSLACAIAISSQSTTVSREAQLEILSFNDVYEMEDFKGNGGPSRVVPIAKQMRKDYDNSLVLFAGDTMSPSVWSTEFRGLQMISAHNVLDVDFACLGNHEFDFGMEAFYNVTHASNFAWLNANCYLSKTKELLPNTMPRGIKVLESPTMGKVTVGVFGVMYDMGKHEDLYWSDIFAAAQREAKILRDVYHVDFVVALTHQLEADDQRLAREIEGIDLIIGGHDHDTMNNIATHGKTETVYLKSTQDFRDVWRTSVKLVWDESGKLAVDMKHKQIDIVKDLPTDPEMDIIIKGYKDIIADRHKVIVGNSCADLDLTENTVRRREAPIGNFVADAAQFAYKELNGQADVALINGGGIRSNQVYPAGNISMNEIIAWHPFGNMVVQARVSGKYFKGFVEKYASDTCGKDGKVVTKNGHFVHASKFEYTLACTGTEEGKLKTLTWKNNEPMTDDDQVIVALPDYMFGKLEDFAGSKNVETVISANEGLRLDAVLVEYIKTLENRNICPKVEGRATIELSS